MTVERDSPQVGGASLIVIHLQIPLLRAASFTNLNLSLCNVINLHIGRNTTALQGGRIPPRNLAKHSVRDV